MATEDTVLEVGALVDLGSFTPAMDVMAETTRAATSSMTSSFQQVASATAAIPPAMEKVSVVTKEATDSMGVDWAELATVVKEQGLKIIETTSEVGAKISETAERSRLGIGTMEAGFSGLAGILGAGIAVGFAADFLDETARVLIELGHLNTTTQISVETLSGLRNVAQQNAIPFENLQVALARMQRAQVQALEGSKMYVNAFKDVGISVEELRNMRPEDLFFRIADGISSATAPQIAMNSGITLMGRGVYTLIPLLEKYGTNLKAITAEAAKNSGVTEEAVATAERWHEQTAKLSQMFQAGMIPVLQAIVNILPKAVALFDALGGTLIGVFEIVGTLTVAQWRLYEVLYDIVTLHFGDLKKDWEQFKDSITSGINEIKGNWDAAWNDINGVLRKPPPSTWFDRANQMMKDLGLNAPKFDLSGITDQSKKKSDIVQRFREELDQMRDAEKGFHELSKNEEAQFWASKLAIVKGNVAAYRAVYHEMVAAERESRHAALSQEMSDLEQRMAATRAGSYERIIVLEEELNYLKRIGAGETSEYRRVQSEMVRATTEAASQEQREYIKKVESDVAESKKDAKAKIASLNEALWFALNTYGIDSEAYRKFTQMKLQAEQEFVDQKKEIAIIDEEMQQMKGRHELDMQKAALDQQYNLGVISAQRRAQLELQLIEKEEAMELAAVAEKQKDYDKDTVNYERAEKEKLAIAEKYEKMRQQIENKQQTERLAAFKKFTDGMVNDFVQGINEMIQQGKTFGQVMAQIWNKMLLQFIDMLARMVIEALIKATVMKAIMAVFGSQTETKEEDKAKAAAKIQDDSAQAQADVFLQAIETVPFPANLAAAPAAAAAVGVMMTGISSQLGKAEHGGLLHENGPIFAHANEMVLPSHISEGLQNAIASGGFMPPASLTQNLPMAGGPSGASHTIHNHNNHIAPKINVAVNGTKDGMKDLHNQVIKVVKDAVRRGSLSMGTL